MGSGWRATSTRPRTLRSTRRCPTLGWDRAYRSGDLVEFDEAGLIFVGRADDQVKLGGRRIELGEVDNAPDPAARRRRRRGSGPAYRRRQPDSGRVCRRRRCLRPERPRCSCFARTCPPRSCRGWRRSTRSRRAPQGRSTVMRFRGRLDDGDRVEGERSDVHRHRRVAGRALVRDPGCRRVRGRPTTSSTSAAAASRRPSWCRGCAARFPEITVADIYEYPTDGRPCAECSTTWRRRRTKQPDGPTNATEDADRPARVPRSPAYAGGLEVADLDRGGEQRRR